MENMNLPFHLEDKKVMTELLENLNVMIKESDAIEEKAIIKKFLQNVSSITMLTVLGKDGVGKTSLLNVIFGGVLGEISPTKEICDFRHGAEETAFKINSNITRYFKTNEILKGIAVVDTQGCNQWNTKEMETAAKEYIQKSDVILVVFAADSIKDYAVWDILEEVDHKKIVFVLNKIDLVSRAQLEEAEIKVRQYMQDAGIDAPVFKVSALQQEIGQNTLTELCTYVEQNIIGVNNILAKEQENISKLKTMLMELDSSFALRKKQYEADLKVLNNINFAMDTFCEKSREKIDRLKYDLKKEISREIDNYQHEIIQRLNPKQIKERFKNGNQDFMEYLEFVNEGYRKRMTDEVNKKTQGAIRVYLTELQDVFEEATGYFKNRESLLTLEDKFYGTLAETKTGMVSEASYQLAESQKYYQSLTNASEELFMKIWKERENYDRKVKIGETVGSAAGGALGATAAGLVVTKGAAATVLASEGVAAAVTTVLGANAGLLVVAAGVMIGGAVLSKMTKKLAAAKSAEDMEEIVNHYIQEFKLEVEKTKEDMTEQILDAVEQIFTKELESADKTFTNFRMAVNIDSKNIPLLEERMDKVQGLMTQINEMEKEYKLTC